MIKKGMLLTIMILFSCKVNSNDNCEFSKEAFFKMVDESGTLRFSLDPFYRRISKEIQSGLSGTTDILGVSFNKLAALGALFKVYDSFISALCKKAGEIQWFPKNYNAYQAKLASFDNEKTNAIIAYNSQIQKLGLDREVVQKYITAKIASIENEKGVVDYLVKEQTPGFFAYWFKGKNPYLDCLDPQFLNDSLNYIYLFALTFLIKNDSDASKFLSCMQHFYNDSIYPAFNGLFEKGDDFTINEVFVAIEKETDMEKKLKPAPLTLDQRRDALNILSSTLTNLAHVTFE